MVASMNGCLYRGLIITPRTHQIRGSGLWTLDILIASRVRIRAFSSHETFATELEARRACVEFGRRIIDGAVKECSVAEL